MDFRACITALKQSGLSINQIAGEIGVTGNAVREVVAGRTKSPRASAAMRLIDLCESRGIKVAKPVCKEEMATSGASGTG